MNSLNKVQLIGNVVDAPEVRETPNGAKVAYVTVATNRTWKDASGEKKEQAEFTKVVLWKGLADIVEQYVGKGKKVYVEGYLQTRSWEDNEGNKKYRTEVVAEALIMLSDTGSRKNDSDFESDEPKPAKKSTKKKDDEIHIEDIPF